MTISPFGKLLGCVASMVLLGVLLVLGALAVLS